MTQQFLCVCVCVWAEVKHRGSAHLFEVCWATFSKLLHSYVSSYCTITYLQQIKLELNPTPAHSPPSARSHQDSDVDGLCGLSRCNLLLSPSALM